MLSFVLPLTMIAIALTPIVASASAIYKRELEAHNCQAGSLGSNPIGSIELNN